MDLKDPSYTTAQCANVNLHESSAGSSEKTPPSPGTDPRWPYLNKWSVSVSPSPQSPQSVLSPLKSNPEPEAEVQQPLVISSCAPESGEEIITSSEDMVSLPLNHSPVTVQDPKDAREAMADAPATSSPSPSLGAWTIPLKMTAFDSMETDKRGKSPSHPVLSDESQWPCLSKQGNKKHPTSCGTSVPA